MGHLQGNALAYCLQALEKVLTYQIGWESLTDENILLLARLIDGAAEQNSAGTGPMKTNVTNCALRIAVLLASNPSQGYNTINKAFQNNGKLIC